MLRIHDVRVLGGEGEEFVKGMGVEVVAKDRGKFLVFGIGHMGVLGKSLDQSAVEPPNFSSAGFPRDLLDAFEKVLIGSNDEMRCVSE